ncbi:MAG TPA: glycosyl hydrolase family 28-related protein, partial [Puia sp.]|nr:glycosyl hydrolase family 28-related protein [Puia sp.]
MRKTNCLVITLVLFIQLAALGRDLPPATSNHHAPHGAVLSTSVFTSRPDDPTATYFIPGKFPITADGRTDVSDALQGAIRDIKTNHNFGILFIPEGKYLITKTIYIPTAIRLIGYGRKRPVFILGKSSPGFQSADPADKGQAKYMFWFTSSLPAFVAAPPAPGVAGTQAPGSSAPASTGIVASGSSATGAPTSSVPDAGASTFYSAMSNIDIRIGEGNPAAVALRTHFAQHSYISHVDISIGNGKAGLFDVGNEMEDVRFFGGDYGIYTTKPSPGWPFMMVDTWFEGQRKAAIRTREAGLTIVRMTAHNVPTVVDIDSNYHEKLFMEDCRFDGVTGPAIRISNEENSFVQINLRNVACRNVPVLTISRVGNPIVTGTVVTSPIYNVRSFTAGLQMDNWSADPK